jgi:hypothetical protein
MAVLWLPQNVRKSRSPSNNPLTVCLKHHPANPTYKPKRRPKHHIRVSTGGRLQNMVVALCHLGKLTQVHEETLYFTGKLRGNTPRPVNPSCKCKCPRKHEHKHHVRVSTGRRLQNVVVVPYPFGKVTKIVVQTLNFTGKLSMAPSPHPFHAWVLKPAVAMISQPPRP